MCCVHFSCEILEQVFARSPRESFGVVKFCSLVLK
jgi:hypothetical protein